MTDAREHNPIPTTAADAGSVSNIRVMLGAFLILSVGLGGMAGGLIRVALHRPGTPYLIVLAVYSILAGCLLGAVLVAVRGRVVRIAWDDRGVAFRVGWYKPRSLLWSWADPIQARLFLGASRHERQRPFLLVLRNGCHEVRIDCLQASWRGMLPFVETLRRRLPLQEAEFNAELIDQGPSLRQDMFAMPASQD